MRREQVRKEETPPYIDRQQDRLGTANVENLRKLREREQPESERKKRCKGKKTKTGTKEKEKIFPNLSKEEGIFYRIEGEGRWGKFL